MRGYFGIGVEGISKAMNAGSLFRTAHAFGASFLFTISAVYLRQEGNRADTSDATGQVPLYHFPSVGSLLLPQGCRLVGVELLDEAVDLPSFRHPLNAAYVLGPERGSLSPALVERCDFVVKIPTRFCVNLAVAAAIVMYDRALSLGRFAPRPVRAGGPTEALAPHVHGGPVLRHLHAPAAAPESEAEPGESGGAPPRRAIYPQP
jgi:tRNA(Leu) C34 or U34 (ribose-2'-O)-methylase TrmL